VALNWQAVVPIPNGHEQENGVAAPNELETASTSAPSTTSSVGIKLPKPTKAEQRAAKREAKDAKSRRKSLKNQGKYNGIVIRADDIEAIGTVLHGEQSTDESHPLASDKCIEDVMERNRGYVTSIYEHKAMLLKEVGRTRRVELERTRKAKKRKERDSISNGSGYGNSHPAGGDSGLVDEEQEALVNAVLIRLGISVEAAADGGAAGAALHSPITPKRSSSAGKSSQEVEMVLAQLRVAIAEDLVKHENEQRSTCIRAGGFWRYVGRPVFDRMMEVAERIDWKTGMLIKSKKALEEVTAEAEGEAEGEAEVVGGEDEVRDEEVEGELRDAVENVRGWVDVVPDAEGVAND
jgi:hypothetical protein